MSLRKFPMLTPGSFAGNRGNAQKSTGPHARRGKAWSRLNHLQEGWHAREYLDFLTALMQAPPGRVGLTARACSMDRKFSTRCLSRRRSLLSKQKLRFVKKAGSNSRENENELFFSVVRSRNVIENKRNIDKMPAEKADICSN